MASGSVVVALIAAGFLADTKQGRAFIRETGAPAAVKALPSKTGKAVGRVVSARATRTAATAKKGARSTQRAARVVGGKTEARAGARWDQRAAKSRPVALVSRVRHPPIAAPAQAATTTPVAASLAPETAVPPSGGRADPAPTGGDPAAPRDRAASDPAPGTRVRHAGRAGVIEHAEESPAGRRFAVAFDDGSKGWLAKKTTTNTPLDVPVSPVAGSAAPCGNTTKTKENDMPEMYFDFTEAPESDSDHLDRLQGLARGLNTISEGIAQYEETLSGVGLDAKSFSGLSEAAEAAAEAAGSLSSAARRFASVYQGVIETVANGTKLPDGKFFTGETA